MFAERQGRGTTGYLLCQMGSSLTLLLAGSITNQKFRPVINRSETSFRFNSGFRRFTFPAARLAASYPGTLLRVFHKFLSVHMTHPYVAFLITEEDNFVRQLWEPILALPQSELVRAYLTILEIRFWRCCLLRTTPPVTTLVNSNRFI